MSDPQKFSDYNNNNCTVIRKDLGHRSSVDFARHCVKWWAHAPTISMEKKLYVQKLSTWRLQA